MLSTRIILYMPQIYITQDGAQVLFTLLDRYESAGNPCFKLNHEDTCDGDPLKCSKCKHGKALQRLSLSLYKAGRTGNDT